MSHPVTSLSPDISMQLPPGPLYLLRNLPYFAVPSTIVYACLTLAKEYLSLDIPTWFTIFAAVLARPTIFIVHRYYSRVLDSRNAAANNAILAPLVREGALSMISKMSRQAKIGYPGVVLPICSLSKPNSRCLLIADLMFNWTKKYGSVFQLRLLTDNRVCLFILRSWSMKKNFSAVSHDRTPPCQGTSNQSRLDSSHVTSDLISTKAILATQFDAFDKGRSSPNIW